jgi:hypothetical protein
MRCGFTALAVEDPFCVPVLGTLPGAAADRTRPLDDTALARTRGEGRGRRCDDEIKGVQQTQPRNDNRRAGDIWTFPVVVLGVDFKSVRTPAFACA